MVDWKNKRVFVTGGSGFIGSHLIRKLDELGADVSALVHKTPLKMPIRNSLIGDLAQKDQSGLQLGLQGFLEETQPEAIFHLAAQPIVSQSGDDALETLQTNVDGTYNLLHVCRSLSCVKSFVHISTDKVFGNNPLILDDSPLNGVLHPYNASKVSGDVIAQMYSNYFDVPMVIIRNANVYGAGDLHFDRIIPRTIKQVLEGKPPVIRGDGSNKRDYIHVTELADGYLRAAGLPYENKLTTLNLGGYNHPVIEVVDSILQKMRRVDLAPVYESQWKGEIPSQHVYDERARELVDWFPKIDLDAGLDLTIPWYEDVYGK